MTSICGRRQLEESREICFFVPFGFYILTTIPVSHFGIGIDTARYGHHVSFMDENKRTASKAFHFEEHDKGYQKLLKALEALAAKSSSNYHFNIRIDAAGQYADNFIHWLHKQKFNMTISVGTTAKNKNYREVHYSKRKADPVESLGCARFAVVERPPAMLPPNPAFSTLRSVVSAMEANATNLTRLVNQLHLLLATCFPELAMLVNDISKGYCLAMLAKYPTAKRLAAAKIDSILDIPHMDSELAKKLYQAAKSSTAHATDEIQEELVKTKLKEVLAGKQQSIALLKIMKNAWDSLPNGPHQRIHSIKGIGLQTAAALVAKMVKIDRFQTDSALIGYFGIFPEETDTSGTNRDGTPKKGTSFHMCRKGNDHVRRLLYTAAQSAVKHNPAVRALYARQAAMGKPYNVIMGHCMAKLLRQVYAVWAKDENFDPEYETKEKQAKEKEKAVGPSVDAPQSLEVTTTDSKVIGPKLKGKRPPINFAAFKGQLSIAEVLRSHNWKVGTSRGQQLRGPCPIHNGDDKDRSFAVHVGKNTFCCHSCDSKGNALDLLTALSDQSLHDAAWDWIDRTGISPQLL